MSVREEICERLRGIPVAFAYHEHEPARTMEDCLALPYAEADVTFCKNILLCNRQQTAYYLYVTLPDKPFRTADVSKALGVSRLSFAPEEKLEELLRVHSGSLSPLGLWFDRDRRVTLVIDRDIRQPGRIAFHPCDNSATVLFTQEDFFTRVLPALPGEPVMLSVPWPGGKEPHA